MLEEPGPPVGLREEAVELREGLLPLHGKGHPLEGEPGVPAVHLLHPLEEGLLPLGEVQPEGVGGLDGLLQEEAREAGGGKVGGKPRLRLQDQVGGPKGPPQGPGHLGQVLEAVEGRPPGGVGQAQPPGGRLEEDLGRGHRAFAPQEQEAAGLPARGPLHLPQPQDWRGLVMAKPETRRFHASGSWTSASSHTPQAYMARTRSSRRRARVPWEP